MSCHIHISITASWAQESNKTATKQDADDTRDFFEQFKSALSNAELIWKIAGHSDCSVPRTTNITRTCNIIYTRVRLTSTHINDIQIEGRAHPGNFLVDGELKRSTKSAHFHLVCRNDTLLCCHNNTFTILIKCASSYGQKNKSIWCIVNTL